MKNRQHNSQKKRDKRTNNNLQNITQKTNEEQTTQWPKEKGQKDKQRSTKHTHKSKDRVKRIPLKTGSELRYSGRVNSSCSTITNRKVLTVFYLGDSLHVVFFVHMCVNDMKDRHKTPFLAADFTRWGDVQDVYWLLTELSSPDGGKIKFIWYLVCTYKSVEWVGEWVLFKANSAIFQQ